MLAPVSIDISDFINTWNLTTEETELFVFNVLDEIGTRFSEGLHNVAGKDLKQSKKEYQKGIYIEKPDDSTLIVGLSGWLPNAIERGVTPFDMKEGFQKSSKKIRKKDGKGWYLTIPFRVGTPGIEAESSIFSSIMPSEVYKVALNNLKAKGDSLKLSQLPSEFQIKGTRKEVTNIITNQFYESYQHKSAQYEGLQKSTMESHGQYVTFRRVSDLSDPNAWIHSGITAHDLMGKTLQNFPFENIISNVKEKFLSNR